MRKKGAPSYNQDVIRDFTKEWNNVTSELKKTKHVDLSKIKLVPEGEELGYGVKTVKLLEKVDEAFGKDSSGIVKLAAMAGISMSTMRVKLRGKQVFSRQQVEKICEILSIPENERGDYFD